MTKKTSMGPAPQDYDFIVVGGGTAGSVLAARLSEDENIQVLLLEAGAREPLDAMAVPAAWISLMGSSAEWGDPGAVNGYTGAPIATPRGRCLGGSSSINGMNFLRGHRSTYDVWPTQGAPGWGFADLLPTQKRCWFAVSLATRAVTSPPRQLTPRPRWTVCASCRMPMRRPLSPPSCTA
jgi:choline dehydrogenase-like flavoprotein